MAVTDRAARAVLAAVVVALLAAVLQVHLPAFWGDGATYYTMASSLAEDLDLEYEARDVVRVRREFPQGPQGIFMKRASGGFTLDGEGGGLHRVPRDTPRIYFAKANLYPLVGAPFVRLLGPRGLLVVNVLSLGVALLAAYAELRRRCTPAVSLAGAGALVLATVAPVYVLWPTPELFGLGLIAGGLWSWRSSRPLLAAFLLGLAIYVKPYNLFLALPLGLEPLLFRAPAAEWARRGLLQSVRRGVVLTATVLSLFGLNKAITGELNYQGGERKTFYGTFPFERDGAREVTFGNSGIWMTTDQLGPLVEGTHDEQVTRRTGPPRPAEEIRLSFLRNLGYFWVGRFGGAVVYFLPVILAVIAFLLTPPRGRAGWLALSALFVSYLFYIRMIPDNWYGGGGTLGNRYFLNLVPLGAVLLPARRTLLVALLGTLGSAALLWPLWVAPLYHSLHPGAHATRPLLRAFPAEMTMLNDLAVFTELWRKKQPFGDTEGDAHRHWPADPKAYYLYFIDDGTYGRETHEGREGFWLRGGQEAEVILRALEPVRRVNVTLVGGPAGDEVTMRVDGLEERVEIAPGETRTLAFDTTPGFPYYDTFNHVIRLRSRRGGVAAEDASRRTVGTFVSFALEVNRRPRASKSERAQPAQGAAQEPALAVVDHADRGCAFPHGTAQAAGASSPSLRQLT